MLQVTCTCETLFFFLTSLCVSAKSLQIPPLLCLFFNPADLLYTLEERHHVFV